MCTALGGGPLGQLRLVFSLASMPGPLQAGVVMVLQTHWASTTVAVGNLLNCAVGCSLQAHLFGILKVKYHHRGLKHHREQMCEQHQEKF